MTHTVILYSGRTIGGVEALELSKRFPGTWWLGSATATWACGTYARTFLHERHFDTAMRGRRIVEELTGEPKGWTASQQARAILKWTGLHRSCTPTADRWLSESGWHFHRARCGVHEDQGLWDIQAAYFEVLRRLPSPFVHCRAEGALFPLPSSEAEDRWRRMLSTVGSHKGIRNCLVGLMAGGGCGGFGYRDGSIVRTPILAGPLRDTAALVVRTVYDLTRMAADAGNAVYANTDCVMMDRDREPNVWGDYGFPYRLEAAGQSEVVAIGCYRIGSKQTEIYREGHRHECPTESPTLPPVRLADWLLAA